MFPREITRSNVRETIQWRYYRFIFKTTYKHIISYTYIRVSYLISFSTKLSHLIFNFILYSSRNVNFHSCTYLSIFDHRCWQIISKKPIFWYICFPTYLFIHIDYIILARLLPLVKKTWRRHCCKG